MENHDLNEFRSKVTEVLQRYNLTGKSGFDLIVSQQLRHFKSELIVVFCIDYRNIHDFEDIAYYALGSSPLSCIESLERQIIKMSYCTN